MKNAGLWSQVTRPVKHMKLNELVMLTVDIRFVRVGLSELIAGVSQVVEKSASLVAGPHVSTGVMNPAFACRDSRSRTMICALDRICKLVKGRRIQHVTRHN